MSKFVRYLGLFLLAIIISIVLNACNRSTDEGLAGYDYKGISIGDGKESVTKALGEPYDDDLDEESGVYSSMSYTDAEFTLKNDKVIAMSIHRDFTLPNGVSIDDPFSKAFEVIGEGELLQESNKVINVYQIIENDYAIALSFVEEDGELYDDSTIGSIMIADGEEMFRAGGKDFGEFKKRLAPVKYKERPVTEVKQTESTAIEYSKDFYGQWSPLKEGGVVYIELDEWGRGVLEINYEDGASSYMIYKVEESEQETVVEYDDEAGVTHKVSMSIQNGILHLSDDTGFVGTYKRDSDSNSTSDIDPIRILSGQWYPDGGISNLTPYSLEFSNLTNDGGMVNYINLSDLQMSFEEFTIEGFEESSIDLYFDFDKIKVTIIDDLHIMIEEYGNTSKFVKVYDPEQGNVGPRGYKIVDLSGKWKHLSNGESRHLTFICNNEYEVDMISDINGKVEKRSVNVSKHYGNEKSLFYQEQERIMMINVKFISYSLIEVTDNGITIQYEKVEEQG